MKTLKTDINGGFPFELDDLRWIENGINEAFGMSGNMIGDNFVINGILLSISLVGSDYHVTHTAGKVFFDGEFCEVDELSSALVILSGNQGYFEKYVEYDPAGNESFEDAISHDTYKITKVRLSTGSSVPSGAIEYVTFAGSANRIPALLVEKIQAEKIKMTNALIFANGSSTSMLNSASVGYFNFDGSSNAQSVTFTTPVVNLGSIDSSSSSKDGAWKLVTFNGTGGSTEFEVIHNTGASVGLRYKILTRDGVNRIVKSGETCLFWNDGSNWILVSGGRTKNVTPVAVSFASGWGNAVGSDVMYSKNDDGLVKMTGQAVSATYTTGSSDLVSTLPIGFRPVQDENFTVTNFFGITIGILNIGTNGEIRYTETGLSSANVQISLSCVSFYISQ